MEPIKLKTTRPPARFRHHVEPLCDPERPGGAERQGGVGDRDGDFLEDFDIGRAIDPGKNVESGPDRRLDRAPLPPVAGAEVELDRAAVRRRDGRARLGFH